MKKRILLALAILSTVAFGAGIDDMSATTQDITLKGRSVKPVEITADTTEINFGTILVGQISEQKFNVSLIGEPTFSVNLSTTKTGDSDNTVDVKTDLTGAVALLDGTGSKEIVLTYTPLAASHELEATLTVTATYAD
ncbi:MAG: hypothetical protein ACRC8F_06900 [Cetobacterium sp.]